MTKKINLVSFHSTGGGTGKTTLATLSGMGLARSHPDVPVYVVDMDLTGTSIADVMPLTAPRWKELGAHCQIDLRSPTDGFLDSVTTRQRIEARHADKLPIGVPFLNDYILFDGHRYEDKDVPIRSIAWQVERGPANLWVLPSSALPHDIMTVMPVICDEEHAAFIEARLEHLLNSILKEDDEAYVVFDTSSSIVGTSRSVLSLLMRLSAKPRASLAEDGFIPGELQNADITAHAFFVSTPDRQSDVSTRMWLADVPRDSVIRHVINRVDPDDSITEMIVINEGERLKLNLVPHTPFKQLSMLLHKLGLVA